MPTNIENHPNDYINSSHSNSGKPLQHPSAQTVQPYNHTNNNNTNNQQQLLDFIIKNEEEKIVNGRRKIKGSGRKRNSISSLHSSISLPMMVSDGSNNALTAKMLLNAHERANSHSHSHYSADKSGSSGYYSSNLCSTYSIEDHIYCEPAIHERRNSTTTNRSRRGAVDVDVDVDGGSVGSTQNTVNYFQDKINENLRGLETSIKNLDRHLNNSIINSNGVVRSGSSSMLPTIMEGIIDSPRKQNDDHDTFDDSLMDIDFDSFLLTQDLHKHVNSNRKTSQEENNYKCSKYVNSCPENVYKIDSDLGRTSYKSLKDFLKCYDNSGYFESTRELLDEIETRLKILSDTNKQFPSLTCHLDKTIEQLKNELRKYLILMSSRNKDLELKKFCTSLVNDDKVVKLTKAFEKHQVQENEYEIPYVNVRNSIVDPNFKMKPKRIYEEEFYHPPPPLPPTPSSQLQRNLSIHRNILNTTLNVDIMTAEKQSRYDDKISILEWHKNKPSSWELYYGTNRRNQNFLAKRGVMVPNDTKAIVSYPSSRPESDFTLDFPRAEQLRLKLESEKKFRQRCRYLTTFLSLVFFLLTVMVVSLVLTKGKRMFGSTI
ncbi:hypothetical protein ACFFRR_008553 [Megaselia abdita]